MFVIHFSKERGQEILDALVNGKPLPCSPDGWSGNDAAATAGALLFLLYSQGPHDFQRPGPTPQVPDTTNERMEAIHKRFHDDLHAGIEFYSQLFDKLHNDEYDDHFEDRIVAMLSEKKAVFHEGLKDRPDTET